MANLLSKSPQVTVIIPTYNSSSTLQLTLLTVLRQDLEDFEVWVVGDGCTDGSERVVASFGDQRVRWMNLARNSGGPSAPRNEGLRRAGARFIAYIGHDDLWFPWHLSGLVACATQGRYDLVCSLGAIIGPRGLVGAFTLPREPWKRDTALSPSNWLHRREAVDVVGPWNESLRTAHDRDFAQRMLSKGLAVGLQKDLSVVKFPSTLWRMYSLTSVLPQVPYVEAIQRDPDAARLELLTELGLQAASQGWVRGTPRGSLKGLLRTLQRTAVEAYGVSHWPLSWIQYRRRRRRAGLSARRRP